VEFDEVKFDVVAGCGSEVDVLLSPLAETTLQRATKMNFIIVLFYFLK